MQTPRHIMLRLLLLGAFGCSQGACLGPREKLLVIVEDPDGLATSAVSLAVGGDLHEPTLYPVGAEGFPLRVLLTADRGEVRARITIDALGPAQQGNQTLARAIIFAIFDAPSTRSVVAQLAAACVSTEVHGEICSLSDGSGVRGICTSQGCGPSACGDGFVDAAAGELCDDHNLEDGDACESTCMPNVCGDGSWFPAVEACDDGNTVDGDGCTADCSKREQCSDQIIDANEACDDGNDDPNDGCDACGLTDWPAVVVLGMHHDGDPLRMSLQGGGGLAFDNRGNVLIADTGGHRLWRLDTTTNLATRLAGTGIFGFFTTSSPLASAIFTPHGIATDPLGNIYFALQLQHSVYKIGLDGVMSRVAGTKEAGFSGDHTQRATDARLNSPTGLAWVPALGLVITDTGNHRVRLLDYDDQLRTIAGSGPAGNAGGAFGGDGGPAILASLNWPTAVTALTSVGPYSVAIADTGNQRIRMIHFNGDISTLAGTGAADSAGDDGPAVDAALNGPTSVTEAPNGDLVITEGGAWFYIDADLSGLVAAPGPHAVRRIRRSDGVVENILRVEEANSTLNLPVGVISSGPGEVLVSDRNNQAVIQIEADGSRTVVAGRHPGTFEQESAPALSATWFIPAAAAYDHDGSLLITEFGGHRIHRLGDDGILRVIAGGGPVGILLGSYDGDGGPASEARLHHPHGIAVAPLLSTDALYFCDVANAAIRAIDKNGVIRTVAGDGTRGTPILDGGLASDARLGNPQALAVDHDGHIVFADGGNHIVAEIDMTAMPPTIHRVAGTGAGIDGDEPLAFDQPLVEPVSVAVDASNNIYIADIQAHKLRYVSRVGPRETWTITTIAGNGSAGYTADGVIAKNAALGGPVAVAVGPDDAPTFIDIAAGAPSTTPGRIRTIINGAFSTIAGGGPDDRVGDGGPALGATLTLPGNLTPGPAGGWTVVGSDLIRQIDASGIISTIAGGIFPGDGSYTEANLLAPWSMVALQSGTWMVADGLGLRLRLVDLETRSISTVLGYPGGEYGAAGERVPVGSARLPWQVTSVVHANLRGSFYFAERMGSVVQKIRARLPEDATTWTTEIFVGAFEKRGIEDGDFATARLGRPTGLALNAEQSVLYISDQEDHTLRMVDLETEQVSLFAGTPYAAGFGGDNGPARDALFHNPSAMAFSANGSLYIADSGNHRVRRLARDADGKISGDSLVSTIIGVGLAASIGSGAPASSVAIDTPNGLMFGPHGNLFLTSSTTVKVISDGDDGVVGPDDVVHTIYGATPRSRFPEPITRCLTGLGQGPSDAEVLVLDRCQGWLLRLTRQRIAH